MNVSVLIFDFDGVLAESTQVKTEAFRTLYRPYGNEVVEKVTQHHLLHGGISRYEKFKHYHSNFLGKHLSQLELDTLADQFSQLVIDHVVSSPWVPGVRDFLEEYRGKVPMYIVSGTPENELKSIVDARQMAHYFDSILGSPTTKPVHIRRILHDHEIPSNQAVMFGDAMSDWQATQETETHFIGRHCIDDPTDFPKDTFVVTDFQNFTLGDYFAANSTNA